MPISKMKMKSGNEYNVTYVVTGSMDNLSTEDLKVLAERYLRSAARSYVLGKMSEIEPSIAYNIAMYTEMKNTPGFPAEAVEAFFKKQGLNLEVPTSFEVPLAELIPSADSKRGKKAADIFSASTEEDDDDEAETQE